jgi:hypothetical protein
MPARHEETKPGLVLGDARKDCRKEVVAALEQPLGENDGVRR